MRRQLERNIRALTNCAKLVQNLRMVSCKKCVHLYTKMYTLLEHVYDTVGNRLRSPRDSPPYMHDTSPAHFAPITSVITQVFPTFHIAYNYSSPIYKKERY